MRFGTANVPPPAPLTLRAGGLAVVLTMPKCEMFSRANGAPTLGHFPSAAADGWSCHAKRLEKRDTSSELKMSKAYA